LRSLGHRRYRHLATRGPISGMRSDPPWDFFHDASIASLQSFELSRLNNAANIRRQIAALLDQWVNDNSQALLARWVREQRALPRPAPLDEFATMEQPQLAFDASVIPPPQPRRSDRPQKLVRSPRR
jgi:hypothetical protein